MKIFFFISKTFLLIIKNEITGKIFKRKYKILNSVEVLDLSKPNKVYFKWNVIDLEEKIQ